MVELNFTGVELNDDSYTLTPIKYMDENGKVLVNNGEFFGMLIDESKLSGLYPTTWMGEHDITYGFDVDSIVRMPDYETKIKGQFPLIMKKLDDHLALELISGLTVEVDDTGELSRMSAKDLTPELYDDFIKHYGSRGYTIDHATEYGESNCYLVDDNFKKMFADYYEDDNKRVLISNYLKDLTKAMSEEFNKEVKKDIDLVHGIANVDNMMYDAGGRNL